MTESLFISIHTNHSEAANSFTSILYIYVICIGSDQFLMIKFLKVRILLSHNETNIMWERERERKKKIKEMN